MRQLSRFVPHVLVVVFAAWCLIAVRNDLSQLSLAPVLNAWDVVLIASLLSLVNYALRIVRWRSFLARLGFPFALRFTALTYCAGFAYTISPGKVGEMVRARYYVPLGVPPSKVTAAFFAERLMDLVAMVALAALLFSSSSRYSGAILGAAALVVGVLATLALLPWSALATAIGSTGWIPNWLRSPLAGIAAAVASTRTLLSPAALAGAFAIGLVAWGLEGAGLGLLSSMFPSGHLDPVSAIGIYGVAVLIGGLSFLPGGLGSTEAVMAALLATRGFSVSEALLITLTCRLVTLWFAVGLGWLAVFALRQKTSAEVVPWQ